MLDENIFAGLPQLETERLILRRFTMDDAPDVFEYASDEDVARYVGWDQHKSIDDAIAFLNRVVPTYQDPANKEWTWGVMLKENRKIIGACGIWGKPKHARAEIGYVIGRAYWGQGIVPEAVGAILKLGFERIGLNRIEAMCHPNNRASARVMEKSGMTYEGTLREHAFMKGSFWDWKVYAILRREYVGKDNKSDQG